MGTSEWLVVGLHHSTALLLARWACVFTVGLGYEVTNLGLCCYRCCLAGLGVACGGSPSCLLVGTGCGVVSEGGGSVFSNPVSDWESKLLV
jgi:hypothetical protein